MIRYSNFLKEFTLPRKSRQCVKFNRENAPAENHLALRKAWARIEKTSSCPKRSAAAGGSPSNISNLSEAGLRTGEREDRDNRWVFAPLLILTLLSGRLPALYDRHAFLTLDGDAVRWIGVALFAAGGALRLAPTFVLNRRFSGLVAIQPGHQPVTTGLYGLTTRNLHERRQVTSY